MPKPFRFRLLVDLPELDARAGDLIYYTPEDPGSVRIVHRVPKARALDAIHRLRQLSASLPTPCRFCRSCHRWSLAIVRSDTSLPLAKSLTVV